MTAGEQIHLVRRRSKLSMREITELSGVSASTICRIEQNKPVLFANVAAVCYALDISLDTLATIIRYDAIEKALSK